ncbi:hypothetical protein Scep_024328 [Stephania cephalantha]|uniref:Uncharacterized protein n=1 Tax=Stephania cephalantha TaxID=152367 RepID=A0AAP0F3H9_9MAGN
MAAPAPPPPSPPPERSLLRPRGPLFFLHAPLPRLPPRTTAAAAAESRRSLLRDNWARRPVKDVMAAVRRRHVARGRKTEVLGDININSVHPEARSRAAGKREHAWKIGKNLGELTAAYPEGGSREDSHAEIVETIHEGVIDQLLIASTYLPRRCFVDIIGSLHDTGDEFFEKNRSRNNGTMHCTDPEDYHRATGLREDLYKKIKILGDINNMHPGSRSKAAGRREHAWRNKDLEERTAAYPEVGSREAGRQ